MSIFYKINKALNSLNNSILNDIIEKEKLEIDESDKEKVKNSVKTCNKTNETASINIFC